MRHRTGPKQHDRRRPGPHRDSAIHWPKAFDPATAPVFSHNELLLHADCHRVWTQLIDAPHWPDWFLLTRDVTSDHPGQPIEHGTLLHLKIFGSPITSRIDEFVPDSRLSWIPQGLDEITPAPLSRLAPAPRSRQLPRHHRRNRHRPPTTARTHKPSAA